MFTTSSWENGLGLSMLCNDYSIRLIWLLNTQPITIRLSWMQSSERAQLFNAVVGEFPSRWSHLCGKCLTPPPPLTKWLQFRSRHIQYMVMHEKFLFCFKLNLIEVCSKGSNWQLFWMGSDNGLVPNRRQAIIWTNADSVHWRIYTALGACVKCHDVIILRQWQWSCFSSQFPLQENTIM